jgi:hypothetical protein
MTPDGELQEASFGAGRRLTRVVVVKRQDARGSTGSLVFSRARATLLEIAASLSSQPHGNLALATITFTGTKVRHRLTLDARQLVVPRTGGRITGLAQVQIEDADHVWKGGFDFERWKPVIQGQPLAREPFLPAELVSSLAPFNDALNAQAAHYQNKSLGVFSPVHGVPPIDVKGKSVLGTLCRSAVYATAAAAAAMCCVDTVGAGCILCVSAGAAAGSALADQCPD